MIGTSIQIILFPLSQNRTRVKQAILITFQTQRLAQKRNKSDKKQLEISCCSSLMLIFELKAKLAFKQRLQTLNQQISTKTTSLVLLLLVVLKFFSKKGLRYINQLYRKPLQNVPSIDFFLDKISKNHILQLALLNPENSEKDLKMLETISLVFPITSTSNTIEFPSQKIQYFGYTCQSGKVQQDWDQSVQDLHQFVSNNQFTRQEITSKLNTMIKKCLKNSKRAADVHSFCRPCLLAIIDYFAAMSAFLTAIKHEKSQIGRASFCIFWYNSKRQKQLYSFNRKGTCLYKND